MKKTVKLSPKQLEALNQIQNQKQQLNKAFQDLNEKESLITTFVLENQDIDVKEVKQLDLEGENLIVLLKEKEKVVKPKKTLKVETKE